MSIWEYNCVIAPHIKTSKVSNLSEEDRKDLGAAMGLKGF